MAKSGFQSALEQPGCVVCGCVQNLFARPVSAETSISGFKITGFRISHGNQVCAIVSPRARMEVSAFSTNISRYEIHVICSDCKHSTTRSPCWLEERGSTHTF